KKMLNILKFVMLKNSQHLSEKSSFSGDCLGLTDGG
ncbi:hypothetical protein CEXT_384111, partial [Caerostris extrusa]